MVRGGRERRDEGKGGGQEGNGREKEEGGLEGEGREGGSVDGGRVGSWGSEEKGGQG